MVYAALAPEKHEVKIGVSAAPFLRMKALSRARGGTPVLLLAEIDGGLMKERSLQHRLRGHRLEGEWFRECPEVMAVVSEMMFIERGRRRGGDRAVVGTRERVR